MLYVIHPDGGEVSVTRRLRFTPLPSRKIRRIEAESPSVIRIIKLRRVRWAGHVARMGEKRNVYRLLVGKPEEKRSLERPRRRRIDNIKMDLLEIGLSVVDWIDLAQDRYRWRALVNAVMNLRVP
jgi:hypothetical protein